MIRLPFAPVLAVALLLPCLTALATEPPAQPASASHFDPVETFADLSLPQPVNSYRSANGAPGPAYWQNRADYTLRAHLLPKQRALSATEVITYTNNSPDTLDCLWVKVSQNIYRNDSRAHYGIARWQPPEPVPATDGPPYTDGFKLDSVEVEAGGRTAKADYVISDTRMQIRLAQPLKSHSRIRLHLSYHYTVPGWFGGRTSWGRSKNGEIFDIAQWYPRMAVYDDLRGWDTLPYLASEFYLEYGDFDYTVTVPSDMLVAGGGELLNPAEVLTAKERARLEQARRSDRTVMIRGPEEVTDPTSRPKRGGELTWHFRMKNTRDVAFAASAAFIWDAARINLPDHRSALAMSFYPVESAGPDAWGRSTEFVKDAVQNFSRRWYPFPWPAAINVGGPTGGMEYPGMAFDGEQLRGKPLFWVSAHEIGHSWFPMLVGFDERRDAWMDEGFNTFIDVLESDDFDHGALGPKRDGEYAPGGGNPVEEIQTVLHDPNAPILLTRADVIPERYRHPVTYFKSALGLVLLREQILGKERFDFAFRKFVRDWAFKHPSPSDFFRAMESAGGEDLSWFWRGWYFNNWNADLAVQKVTYDSAGPAHGATVTVANLDRLVMPATLQVEFTDGTRQRLQLPVETWIRQRTAEIPVDSTKPIASVTIDPDQVIPDANRANNALKGPFSPAAPTASSH